MSFRTARRRGFTLVELMVAIAVIAVLLGILLSGVQRIREAANRTKCANNLAQIGHAYWHYVDKNNAETTAFKGKPTWVSNLKPFLDGRDDIFFCPSAVRMPAYSDEVPKAWIHVRNTTYSEYGGSHDIPLSKGAARMRLQANRPGPVPGSYYLEMEDSGDNDFNDLVMLIAPSPNGAEVVITAVSKDAGYTFDFVGPDGNILVSDYRPGPNSVVTLPGGWSLTHYGINSQAAFLGSGDAEKVLAIEYNNVVANVFGTSAPDFWPTASAPRHNGVLNALFRDGSVQAFAVDDMDPRISTVYQRYWLPTIPGPF